MSQDTMNPVNRVLRICLAIEFSLCRIASMDQKIYDEETWILSL